MAARRKRAAKAPKSVHEARQLAGGPKDGDGLLFQVFTMDHRSALKRLMDGDPVTARLLQDLFRDQHSAIEDLRQRLGRAEARLLELEMPKARKLRRALAKAIEPKGPTQRLAGAPSSGFVTTMRHYLDDEDDEQ